MENDALTPRLTPAAATPAPDTDLNAARGIDGVTVVTWGDSVANFIGINLKNVFNNVVNLGRNGAGLDNPIPPQPLGVLPKEAAVLISMGGNDVEGLIGKPQQDIDAYALRVVAIAEDARRQDATPVIIGHGTPPAPYTGPVPGGVSRWAEPGFYETWVETMHRLNAAVEHAAGKAGIAWSRVDGRVPDSEHASDNLHYTVRGSRRIAANALKDAGIRL